MIWCGGPVKTLTIGKYVRYLNVFNERGMFFPAMFFMIFNYYFSKFKINF